MCLETYGLPSKAWAFEITNISLGCDSPVSVRAHGFMLDVAADDDVTPINRGKILALEPCDRERLNPYRLSSHPFVRTA